MLLFWRRNIARSGFPLHDARLTQLFLHVSRCTLGKCGRWHKCKQPSFSAVELRFCCTDRHTDNTSGDLSVSEAAARLLCAWHCVCVRSCTNIVVTHIIVKHTARPHNGPHGCLFWWFCWVYKQRDPDEQVWFEKMNLIHQRYQPPSLSDAHWLLMLHSHAVGNIRNASYNCKDECSVTPEYI